MRCKFCGNKLERGEDQCPRCGGVQNRGRISNINAYQPYDPDRVSIPLLFIGHILLLASTIAYLFMEAIPSVNSEWLIWIVIVICDIIGATLIENSGIKFPTLLAESIILLIGGIILVILPLIGIGGSIFMGVGITFACFAVMLLFMVYPR